ncbi:hypothetical protein ABNX05_11065 [Lysinibacillus sp. M3]|uniref:Uncharacterized protein n=1 Tax=Lysinibacillus zambalensis TaxID=3160866 RepID=A0ABV1MV86_9BACI
MKDILNLIKVVIYAPILTYHLKKGKKYNMDEHPTIRKYHYEKSNYFFEKAYGKKIGEGTIVK